jgi:Holliday junction resolvasome RuvABC endonuclease subunit
MLHIPQDSATTANIIGIDPGSENIGVACIEFDINTLAIVNTQAFTITGSKLMVKDSWLIETHGERIARIKALKERLIEIFCEVNPLMIACETPFFNPRRPNAFAVLVEVLLAIKEAVRDFDFWKVVYSIDPPTVKKSVYAPGNADKVKMKESIMALPDIKFKGNITLDKLDEHSIDAIAVAYCRYRELIKS